MAAGVKGLRMTTIAALSNVARLAELTEALINRPAEVQGFGVFYGRAGLGKTYSAIWACTKYRAWHLEVDSCVTPRGFLLQCCAALGILQPKGTVQALAHQVGDYLADRPRRPLIIDEADHLARRGIIEIVRDVYKRCAPAGSAIILVGEETLPSRLDQWERIASRVLRQIRAEPMTAEDASVLAGAICPDLECTPEVAAALAAAAKGSTRRCVQRLYEIRDQAAALGRGAITTDDAR